MNRRDLLGKMTVGKKHNIYKGKLSAAQIAVGMNIAEENAFRLVEDATIMLDSKRYPTACSLALLAFEELGKVILLRILAVTKLDSDRNEIWKDYRSHTRKNEMLLMQTSAIIHSKIPDDSQSINDFASSHSGEFNQMKQLGFYSDYLGKSHWWNPSKIGEDAARAFVKFAKRLAKNNKHTEKEIELVIEHMGPFWRTDKYLQKKAAKKFRDALKKAGISSRIIMGLGEHPDQEE